MRALIPLLSLLVFASDLHAADVREPNAKSESEIDAALGTYASPAGLVSITKAGYGAVFVSCGDWQSVGFYQDSTYSGIVRMMGSDHRPASAPNQGLLHFRLQPTGHVRAELAWAGKSSVAQLWMRSGRGVRDTSGVHPNLPAPPVSGDPKPGDYVYVEELPEAITRVPPNYPDEARRAGVQGIVMVQALVRRDGTVGDVKVTKSIPLLDQAAMESVRQWTFKPARAKGEPIAVWVAVPIKFTLH